MLLFPAPLVSNVVYMKHNVLHYISSVLMAYSVTYGYTMGFLPNTSNCGCACAGNAGNVFPATAVKQSRHATRHVRDARAVMHARITNSRFPLNSAAGENVPGIPGACATRNFTYLVRGPWRILSNICCIQVLFFMKCHALWKNKRNLGLCAWNEKKMFSVKFNWQKVNICQVIIHISQVGLLCGKMYLWSVPLSIGWKMGCS